jgi:hypothetical protein
MDDAALLAALPHTTVFARVSPEDKARIVRAERLRGSDVAFLGDGVNDAVALHAADVGVSVDSATDVAKDAADVLLLEKDLGVLADGVTEGRRVFANTIKYLLMGTSSNFGNMFSAAGASALLTFLLMLPSQIPLNNLIYDLTQVAIPPTGSTWNSSPGRCTGTWPGSAGSCSPSGRSARCSTSSPSPCCCRWYTPGRSSFALAGSSSRWRRRRWWCSSSARTAARPGEAGPVPCSRSRYSPGSPWRRSCRTRRWRGR